MREETEFNRRWLLGDHIKEVIKIIFESSGYQCFDFGFEENMRYILRILERDKKQNDVIRRVRSMPDVFAYKENQGYLLEVKYLYNFDPEKVFLGWNVKNYIKFWNEAHLIIVSYSQTEKKPLLFTCPVAEIKPEMMKFKTNLGERYDLRMILEPVEEVFKLNKQAIEDFKTFIEFTDLTKSALISGRNNA